MVFVLWAAVRKSSPSTWRSVRHIHIPGGKTPETLRAQGPARTRFAPSPTGYLHLGSLRTALFNYLVAKATGGQFVLRIEDTDQKRTVPDAEERLYEDLKWTGIEFDEGPTRGGPYGPYKQSERTEIYREHTGHLLESGNAYRCFCTAERLHTLAEHRSKLGLPPDYDRTCAHIPKEESDDRASKGESHVVRLKVPDKYPVFEDLVYGIVRQRKDPRLEKLKQTSFDDPILLKTDGFPTYHLANVVDDHLMEITHVIRGSEWMSSTPKHLAMYQAFGWAAPSFAHVGLLVDQKRQKLSKRTGSIDITSYRQQGIFPETLNNFVALLGWSHYEKGDVMAMEDLIRNFSLKFTKGNSIVSFEKLFFLQRRHASRYSLLPSSKKSPQPLEELALKPLLAELFTTENLKTYSEIPSGKGTREKYVRSILMADVANYTTPSAFIARNIFFFRRPTTEELKTANHLFESGSVFIIAKRRTIFQLLLPALKSIPLSAWKSDKVKAALDDYVAGEVSTSMHMAHEMKMIKDFEKANYEEDYRVDSHSAYMYEADYEDNKLVYTKEWKKIIMGYLRWALVGGMPGADTIQTMTILGRDEVLGRLEEGEKMIIQEGPFY